SLAAIAAVGWPSAAIGARAASESTPLDPSTGRGEDQADGARPSTSDEDETVNGSLDGPWLSQSNLDSVSRETLAPGIGSTVSDPSVSAGGFGFTRSESAGGSGVGVGAIPPGPADGRDRPFAAPGGVAPPGASSVVRPGPRA